MLKKLLNNNKFLISISVLSALVIIVVYSFKYSDPNYQISSILSSNNVNGLENSILYDEKTKTIKLDADLMEENEYSATDIQNFLKSFNTLFANDLVHQFEFTRKNTTDEAGGTNLVLRIQSGTPFRFKEEVFHSLNWSREDKGICERNIKIIPPFAHVTKKVALELEKALKVEQCKLWNEPKHFKRIA